MIAGTTGAIDCKYDGTAFDIEFFDLEGNTIDVVTTPSKLLIIEESYKASAWSE